MLYFVWLTFLKCSRTFPTNTILQCVASWARSCCVCCTCMLHPVTPVCHPTISGLPWRDCLHFIEGHDHKIPFCLVEYRPATFALGPTNTWILMSDFKMVSFHKHFSTLNPFSAPYLLYCLCYWWLFFYASSSFMPNCFHSPVFL